MYYKKKEINKKVYDYCIKERIVDAELIAKWKKVFLLFINLIRMDMKNYAV